MFRRKLRALGHPSGDRLNMEDPEDLKIVVIWLEDQKIRHYKIENRAGLHNHQGEEWKQTFHQYLNDLQCPFNFSTHPHSVIDWLFGVAVRHDYGDAAKEHVELRCGLNFTHETLTTPVKSALDIDPLDKTFAAGVRALAKIMQVTHHPDPSVLLEAVRIVIQETLSNSKLEDDKSTSKKKKKESKMFNVSAKDCGFDLGDPVLNEAAKVLRLLHIQELRDLQTHINEVIVTVQAITADPKTDQSLGRVGI